MKKVKTYGKRISKREIYVKISDKFDDVSDESDPRSTSSHWIKTFSTNGWCQPRSDFSNSKSSEVGFVEDVSQNYSKSCGILASTPYSSSSLKIKESKTKLRERRDLRSRMFKGDIGEKVVLGESFGSEDDVSDIVVDSMKIISLKDNLNPILIESPIQRDSIAPCKCLCSLHDEHKDSLCQFSVETNHVSTHLTTNAQMTFLEVLTPYRLQDENENKRTFFLDRSCTPETRVLSFCGQEQLMDINNYFESRTVIRKVGEGVYGEVFEAATTQGNIAIKIVPVEGDSHVNGELQKKFSEVLSEIVISKELTDLSIKSNEGSQVNGFVKLFGVSCVQGRYPKCLLEHWDEWNARLQSENDNPELFDDNQTYVIFETEVSGTPLEELHSLTMIEAKSILHQVTASLAVSEKTLKFEHRDLHWGNILVKETKEKCLPYFINGIQKNINTAGLEIAVIDFTLSRLEKDGCAVFCDLSEDATLFNGVGDYQFEIYRKMREDNGNCWYEFNPKTNVLWVHYLAEKLLTKKLKRKNKKFTDLCDGILNFASTFDMVLDEFFSK